MIELVNIRALERYDQLKKARRRRKTWIKVIAIFTGLLLAWITESVKHSKLKNYFLIGEVFQTNFGFYFNGARASGELISPNSLTKSSAGIFSQQVCKSL